MQLEFDPKMSEANRTKHDIDFVQAPVLWDDPDDIEIAVKTSGEPRFLVVGKMSGKYWSGAITLKEQSPSARPPPISAPQHSFEFRPKFKPNGCPAKH